MKICIPLVSILFEINVQAAKGERLPNRVLTTLGLHFDKPISHQQFTLNLAIDPNTDLVAALGLNKANCEGLELILFRIGQALSWLGFGSG